MPRNAFSTRYKFPKRKSEKRIRIPQPPERPLKVDPRSLIRKEFINKDPIWLVMHRRGPRRMKVGEDPLEARAMPHSYIRGTLPERIIYKFLLEKFHMQDGVEFRFQSSLQGGRAELGGIVADFLFPYLRIVLNPLGPTHAQFLRAAKDREQIMALEEMGFTVFMVEDDVVYNEYEFEAWMRRVFNLERSGGMASEMMSEEHPPTDDPITSYDVLYQSSLELLEMVHGYAG